MSKMPWFQFYASDFKTSTESYTNEEVGAYEHRHHLHLLRRDSFACHAKSPLGLCQPLALLALLQFDVVPGACIAIDCTVS